MFVTRVSSSNISVGGLENNSLGYMQPQPVYWKWTIKALHTLHISSRDFLVSGTNK